MIGLCAAGNYGTHSDKRRGGGCFFSSLFLSIFSSLLFTCEGDSLKPLAHVRSKEDGLAYLVGHLALMVVAHEGVGEEVVVETCGVVLGTRFCSCSAVP